MADELIQEQQDQDAEDQETQQTQAVEDEDFNTDGGISTNTQDSLAINRARAAYGRKSNNSGLRERRTPQRVVTSDYVHDEDYEADDIDDDTLIAPEKGIINKTYKSSLDLREQKSFTPVAESSGGSDVLALQSADSKSGQTISFKVKGIQWKAGYASEFTKTPLGHTMHPIPLPPPTDERPDALKKTGIVIRPVNPKLQKVLNQLLPSSFKKELSREKGKRERLKQLSIFYLPSTQSASVGFIHEFIIPRSDGRDAFYLYIQTSVGKAPVAIIDEVLRTLEAGLPEGEKADIYDYTMQEEQDVVLPEPDYKIAEEVNEAMKQVSNTFNDSIVVHSVKQGAVNFKNNALDLMKQFDKYMARFVRVLAAIILIFMNSLPMKMFISGLRLLTKGLVRLIWAVNKGLLMIARSPYTAKVLGAIGKVFSLFGGLVGALLSGVAFFFKVIGRGIAGAYTATADTFRNPMNFDLGISFPTKKVTFGSGDSTKKKSPVKIKGAKKANIAKPAAKPINKSTASVQGTSKFNQVTKPVLKKAPIPPKLKGTENLQQIPGANNQVGGDANSPVGANNANKTPGNTGLGYFEDEPF
jgi:hypothetical protein